MNDINLLINTYDIIFWIIYLLCIPTFIHIMQQESYQNDGMMRWIAKNPKKAFKKAFIGFLINLGVIIISTGVLYFCTSNMFLPDALLTWEFLPYIPSILGLLAFVIYNSIIFQNDHQERKNAKKPLKYTARVKRLMVYNFGTIVILEVFMIQTLGLSTASELIFRPLIYSFFMITMPVNVIIANWFVSPLESYIGEKYIKKAYKKLKSKEYANLIKIGITGSYGKTSTKFILKTILEEKYNVLATPGSYNTTMGNVRVIREQLKPEHEVFISEMGARKKKDIKEICDFVNPHIGIITSIGPQHLETFKNIETVAKTKGELLDGVLNKNVKVNMDGSIWTMCKNLFDPRYYGFKSSKESEEVSNKFLEDGAVFLPKDGSFAEELYNNDSHENKFLFSATNKKADIFASDIKCNKEGSTFTVNSKKYGKYECKTKLLGEHNVQNIIGAIAIAEYLELTKEQIIEGVGKIEAVEHRLQLLPTSNGTTVIDDAFNSNPVGSKAALDVIKKFDGRKIIITPGMVELGEEEDKLNKEFGKQMASAVDIAILVGPKHTKPIQEGLKENKFKDMNIFVVSNLDEATAKLATITKVGDVILFENDLPDSYNE